MTVHFHVGRTPFIFRLSRREDQSEQELEEKTTALIWYGLHFPSEGQLARYVLRKWAGGAR
jgi:hypothetical protein